jgi:hypothetical protein
MLDHDITAQITHLKQLYAWCSQEDMEYLLYDRYDPIDWIDTRWEYDSNKTELIQYRAIK